MRNRPEQPVEIRADLSQTFRRTLVVISVVAGIALLWYAHDVFLMLFAGLLFGILLEGVTKVHMRYTHLSKSWGLLLTVLVLIGSVVLLVNLLAPGVSEQLRQLEHDLPASIDHLKAYISQYSWGKDIIANLPTVDEIISGTDSLLRKVTGVFSASVNVIIHVILTFVVGIYFAAEPQKYRQGFTRLFPPQRRALVDHMLTRIHDTLWWWVLSILAAMTSISVLTFIGLSILHVPLAMTLALLTGLLTFIPNFGPILSAILPALLGLMESPARALTVILVYVGIQFVESHFVTPLIQRHTIKLPPALGICAQLTFGLLFGFLGLLLAIPLVATLIELVETLYIERMLEAGGEALVVPDATIAVIDPTVGSPIELPIDPKTPSR